MAVMMDMAGVGDAWECIYRLGLTSPHIFREQANAGVEILLISCLIRLGMWVH